MAMIDRALDAIARRVASRVTGGPDPKKTPMHTDVARLRRVMRPGDVLLVDGCDKVSAAIRYLTQSSWSHAALYVGDAVGAGDGGRPKVDLVEMNLGEGCVASSLEKYAHSPTRICRPVNLTDADRRQVVQFMIDRIGLTYDTRHVLDLARYLIPHPPVPLRWRRKMLALGSGEPTRAICSTLIAQAFHSVPYPILPNVERIEAGAIGANGYTTDEILHIRHYSLFTPRDFDVSPYFEVVKPTLAEGFNYKGITWGHGGGPKPAPTAPVALLKRKA